MHNVLGRTLLIVACCGLFLPFFVGAVSSKQKQKDMLDPQCKKEEKAEMKKCDGLRTEAARGECQKRAKRDAFEVMVMQNTGKQVNNSTKLDDQKKEGHYCVQEEKIRDRYGDECGTCPAGVAVISRSVSSGVTRKACNDKEKGYRVFCRGDEPGEEKKGKSGEEKGDTAKSDSQQGAGKPQEIKASCYGTEKCGDSPKWKDSYTDTRKKTFDPYNDKIIAVGDGSPYKYGDQLNVCNAGQCTLATVRDHCPGCGTGKIDLTQGLAEAIGFDYKKGINTITIQRVIQTANAK